MDLPYITEFQLINTENKIEKLQQTNTIIINAEKTNQQMLKLVWKM